MSSYTVPITGYIGSTYNDTEPVFRTWEEKGVKKIEIVRVEDSRIVASKVLEFPQIGHSLPCVFTADLINGAIGIYVTEGKNAGTHIRVVEYGGQPDPNYFNITGVDEYGEPIYASEEEGE